MLEKTIGKPVRTKKENLLHSFKSCCFRDEIYIQYPPASIQFVKVVLLTQTKKSFIYKQHKMQFIFVSVINGAVKQ